MSKLSPDIEKLLQEQGTRTGVRVRFFRTLRAAFSISWRSLP
jgi:hypothetical protein